MRINKKLFLQNKEFIDTIKDDVGFNEQEINPQQVVDDLEKEFNAPANSPMAELINNIKEEFSK